MPKNAHYHTIALISHASKVMLKILQGRLQQYVNKSEEKYKRIGKKKERGDSVIRYFALSRGLTLTVE